MSKKRDLTTVTRAGWEELSRYWSSGEARCMETELVSTLERQWAVPAHRFSNDELASMCMFEAGWLEPGEMRRLGASHPVGWFNFREGNLLRGTLLGQYARRDDLRPGGVSYFYQVLLDGDTEVRAGRGEEARLQVARAGEVVNVNHGPRTKVLESLLPEIAMGAEFVVELHVRGKVVLPGGKTMHDVEVAVVKTRDADPRLLREQDDEDLLSRVQQLVEADTTQSRRWRSKTSRFISDNIARLRREVRS